MLVRQRDTRDWGVDGIVVVLVTVGCELGDWDVDGIIVVLVTGM